MTHLTGHQLIAFRKRLGALRVTDAAAFPRYGNFTVCLKDDKAMIAWTVKMDPINGPRLGASVADDFGRSTEEHAGSPISMDLFASILRAHWGAIEKHGTEHVRKRRAKARRSPAPGLDRDRCDEALRVLGKFREIALSIPAEAV